MSDFKKINKVVQANELITQAHWEMSLTQLKIFKIMISCIDIKNPPKERTVRIKKSQLYKLFNYTSDGHYMHLRKNARELQRKIVEIQLNKTKSVTLSLVSKIYWDKNKDYIDCVFHEEIMPYLIALKGRFTPYLVTDLTSLDSKYGLIIYEYLKSEEWKNETNSKNLISIEDLRILTGTTKKQLDFRNFEKYVLKAAVKDINTGSRNKEMAFIDFLVDYEKIKTGRRITHIKFKTRKRTSNFENDFDIILKPELLNLNKRKKNQY